MDSKRLGESSYSSHFISSYTPILDLRADLVWSFDENFCLVDFNKAFYNTLYKATGQAIQSGQNLMELPALAGMANEWQGYYQQVFQQKQQLTFIAGNYSIDGLKALSEVCLYPIFNEDGKVTQVIGVAENVDRRISIERNLEQANAELSQSIELYRTLASNIPNFGIVIFDSEYRYLLCEGTALGTIGLSKEFYEGKTLYEVMEPEAIERLKPQYDKALAGNTVVFEYTNFGRNYHAQILPIKDAKGIVTRGMIIVNDVTELKEAGIILANINKKLEAEVKERTKQLEDSNKELRNINLYLDDFVHAAAHDLRSPLVNLRTILDLLGRIENQTEKEMLFSHIPELVNGISNTLDGLIRMVELQKKDQLIVSYLVFKDMMEHTCSFFADRITKQQVSITTDFEQAPGVWYIEPKLQSIFFNLISNSLKYAKVDGEVKIHVQSCMVDGDTVLTFWDNGVGIDLAKHRFNLFKPFKRFNDSNVMGTGLGLSLVKNIVEKNGGQVDVESQLNEFTKFTVKLKSYKAL